MAKNIELNFNNYINGYSENVREILENFQIEKIVTKLSKNNYLFMLIDKFTEIDLHPNIVTNHEMGYIFEELLRRFSEMSNETAGEHYTPREVIRLMVNLLFAEHKAEFKGKGIIRTIFDPTSGTGGMLTIAKEHILRFYIDIFWNGQRIRVCSDKTGQSLDSYQRASNLQARIQYEIDNHIFEPSKYVAGDIKKFLFESLFEEWYKTKEQEGYSPSYLPKLVQFSRDYFSSFQGDDVREIKKPHIHKFYYGLPSHLKSKTKKNIMATLKTFFNWLFMMELIEKVPIFPKIRVQDPEWKWIDVEVQGNILLAIPEADRSIYLFLALHGCRPSEARALKFKDITFHGEIPSVTIRRTFTGKSGNILREETKTKKNRVIPINPEFTDILKELCKSKLPEAFVFLNPRTNKPYCKSTYQEIWNTACTKVGVKISPYEGLRHSWASQRASRGVEDIYLISKILGHSDIRTTQRYAHINLEGLKQIMSLQNIVPFPKLAEVRK